MSAAAPLVVIADDNEYLAELVAERFAAKSWRTQAISEGGRVLTTLRTRDVALLLLDIEMPGASGLEILAKLRSDARTAAIPVIMLTGRRRAADVQTAMRLGALEYIVKPFELETLVRRVERRLRATSSPAGAPLPLAPEVPEPLEI